MMEYLAQAIGLPALQAVIDDFIAALRQHPLFAAAMRGVARLDRLRNRLVTFWYAVLDGESYRWPAQAGLPLQPASQQEWRAAQQLFDQAIARHVPQHLALGWQQRLAWLGQTLPLAETVG